MENLCRIFFPNDSIAVNGENSEDSRVVITSLEEKGDEFNISVSCTIDGAEKSASAVSASAGDSELIMARCLYDCLCEITGYIPPWGVLTGVRPSKLMSRLIASEGAESAEKYFRESLNVSEEKTSLAKRVSLEEEAVTALSRPESFSLYVSIPFCPSRCSYCSFVSHSIANPTAAKLLAPYVENLVTEIEKTGEIVSELGLRLESVYFGGGTPGVLDSGKMDTLLTAVEKSFDLSSLREYTVEIGRPDTVTSEKLRALRYHNVGRISINPQTFNQSVLDAVGRKHSVEQAIKAYKTASTYGFDCINMDLIAGLPTESVESFKANIDTALALGPGNITVHTLAIKRSSNLASYESSVSAGREVAEMLSYANSSLDSSGYLPYYMYRQSKCIGNMENVGWCRKDMQCLYNIFMMEECHSVIGVGAGAVTKLKAPHGDYIERIFNYKYPYEYNTGLDMLLDRKERISTFYKEYSL